MPTRAIFALAALLLFVTVPSVARFYTEWLWFTEIGYRSIFLKSFTVKGLLGVGVFAVAFCALFANLRLATRRQNGPLQIFQGGGDIQPIFLERHHIQWIAAGVSAVAGLFLSGIASSQWLVFLQFLNATPFGEADPLFVRDVSFYVFTLPFLNTVRYLLLALVVVSILGSGAVYVVLGQLGLTPQGLQISNRPRQHLGALVAVVFLLLTVGAYLDMPSMLTTPAVERCHRQHAQH